MPPEEFASVRAMEAGRKVEHVEMGVVRPDKKTVWLDVTAAPVNLPGLGVAVTYSDVTARRNAEMALVRSQELAHVGSWTIELPAGRIWWSAETYRIFLVPEGTPIDYETFVSFVHPEDRPQVDAAWQRAVTGHEYDIRHRILRDGRVRWLREKAAIEFNEGRPIFAIGTVIDITDIVGIGDETPGESGIAKESPL
jgi:PAS domain-containing protein